MPTPGENLDRLASWLLTNCPGEIAIGDGQDENAVDVAIRLMEHLLASQTVKLGQRVKHTVTDYEGVVVSRTEWLSGAKTVQVQAEGLSFEGNIKKPEHLDESLVEVVPDADAVPCSSEET